jgi:hypothetical protein
VYALARLKQHWRFSVQRKLAKSAKPFLGMDLFLRIEKVSRGIDRVEFEVAIGSHWIILPKGSRQPRWPYPINKA